MKATIQYIRKELSTLYDPEETEGLIKIIFNYLKGYTLTDLTLRREEVLSDAEIGKVREIVARLSMHEPIQYILGYADFAGLTLKVGPSVLIPRPETEELVRWIIDRESGNLNVLDAGTGSGCIALALKKKCPGWNVSACDISPGALLIAAENAAINDLSIDFFRADILEWTENQKTACFDLIVSNPPYVTLQESRYMNRNVLDYEPHSALFVPDSQPLMFYESILRIAKSNLVPHGRIYFEINESMGQKMQEVLFREGFANMETRKDIHGRDRMIRCVWP